MFCVFSPSQNCLFFSLSLNGSFQNLRTTFNLRLSLLSSALFFAKGRILIQLQLHLFFLTVSHVLLLLERNSNTQLCLRIAQLPTYNYYCKPCAQSNFTPAKQHIALSPLFPHLRNADHNQKDLSIIPFIILWRISYRVLYSHHLPHSTPPVSISHSLAYQDLLSLLLCVCL